ncbi:hypothetical protein [Halarcobacter bivalviorum]|uniref:Uncharacterized protein n=1 Tax=Halarcobacter bivalviorum TaxID=663364 RepID=A0AAX2ABQ7_9BACT|nr:hypothetical protein [Halarcobacter bivalviorum]AXH12180.1 hypothetical protein ABIV_1178 [Halarcobacter bivalviorum]RXK11285.1 hypothetical protein CRV05_02655 [Halarcobacter bivalviorum]
MNFLVKLFLIFVLFIFSLIVFLPKEQLFYQFEKLLLKKEIIVSNELSKDKFFYLVIENPDVFYKKILSTNIEKVQFYSYLLFTKVNIENIFVSKSFRDYLPKSIENLTLSHSILDFKNININSSGKFGRLSGSYNIFNKKIKLELKPSNSVDLSFLRRFKEKEGRYIFEQSF